MLYAHTLTLLRPLALCARPQLCGRFLSPIPLPSHVRHSSHKSLKAIKARKGTPPKSTPKPKVNAPDKAPEPKAKAPDTLFSLPSFVPLEAQLGSLPHPTLLYQKSHWRIALLCYAFTGIGVWVMFNNYQVNIVRPVGIPEWVKKAHYVGIAFIGIGVAAAFVYPARLIRSIYAIPFRPTPEARPAVLLEIHSNNYLSFFLPPLKTQVAVQDIYLERKLTSTTPKVEEVYVYGSPFAKLVHLLSMTPYKLFKGTKEAITREKLVPVNVKSSYLKLVIHEDGWQWEPRGIDRLIGTDKKF